eukprot:gnl/MRDRNA2_/MRDRNA2_85871_c0_seq1.p1 gnl/MRDRNA2_/MRDRNA2_85871_c0~~gnl/MRDRNA2_/MRDRNA2_85871_c0_seq1.p1  ORF type:complete len:553 (+),score=72.90 gnl/MRDRNA2_/MRDRNA2_85871_c0_seq1:120-1778(+)
MARTSLSMYTLCNVLLQIQVIHMTAASKCEQTAQDHMSLLQQHVRLLPSHKTHDKRMQIITASLNSTPAFGSPKTSPFPYSPGSYYGLGKAAAKWHGFFKVKNVTKPHNNECALSLPSGYFGDSNRSLPLHWSRFSFGECPKVLIPKSVKRLEFSFEDSTARGYNPSMVALPPKLRDAFPAGRWLVVVRTGREHCSGANYNSSSVLGSHLAVLDENFQTLTRTYVRFLNGGHGIKEFAGYDVTDDSVIQDMRFIHVDGDEVQISFVPYVLEEDPLAQDEEKLFSGDGAWWVHTCFAKLQLSAFEVESKVVLTAWVDRLKTQVLLRCPETTHSEPSQHLTKNLGFFTSSGILHVLDTIHPTEVEKLRDYHEMHNTSWIFSENKPPSMYITPECVNENNVQQHRLKVAPWDGAVAQTWAYWDTTDGSTKDLEMHNGANLVWIEEYKEFLGIGHFYRGFGDYDVPGIQTKVAVNGHHYTHVFFTLSGTEPFHIQRVSPEFCFQSVQNPNDCEVIQFASSLTIDDDKLHIGYGVMDCESYVATFDLTSALQSLRNV